MTEHSRPNPPPVVPERLIHDAQAGSQRAFEAIYRAHQPGLLRYLGTVAPDIAADVAAATWESVATSLVRFRGDGRAFRGWLITIARRRMVDEVRRSSRRPLAVAEVPDIPDGAVTPDEALDGPEWAAKVLRMIPTRQAEVVALRVIGGLSIDEVADLLGVTPANVRVLSHRGLRAVAAILAEDTSADGVISSVV